MFWNFNIIKKIVYFFFFFRNNYIYIISRTDLLFLPNNLNLKLNSIYHLFKLLSFNDIFNINLLYMLIIYIDYIIFII